MANKTNGSGSKPRRPSVRFADKAQTIESEWNGAQEEQQFALGEEDDPDWSGDLAQTHQKVKAHIGDRNGLPEPIEDINDNTEASHSLLSHQNYVEKKNNRAYGLKSTQLSREAEFEADDSDLEETQMGPSLGSGDVDEGDNMSSPTRRFHVPFVDRIPALPIAVDRARQSISEASGHDLRESLRHAMESEELPEWLRRGAGILDSTWNMSNSILGAGVVGLPYSLKASGCLTGISLILGIALLTDWTIRLIVLNAKLSGRNTYIDIMDYCFGRNGRLAVSVFQGTFAFGGMCAFIVVIGDTIPHVLKSIVPSLEGSFLASRAFIMIACTFTISFPLSLYRSIESLSRASAIALFSMVLIIITVIVRGPAMPEQLKGDPSLRLTVIHPTNVVRSIAVISFAFVCHHNSLLIYSSLKEPSMDRFGKVTHYSTAIAATALVAMSLAGYMTFTDKTLGNVLNNFPEDDKMVNLARFCFGMNMLTTWPLELFVAREVIETYFYGGIYNRQRHIFVTTALTVVSLFVSLLATDLGVVLEVTGGLSATALAFIFPSICYLKLCGQGQSMSSANTDREDGTHDEYQGLQADVDDDLDDPDAEDDTNLRREVNGDISVDEVELPLRPGAQLRRRISPALGGQQTPWYLTTKPLAIGCTAFGCFVLVVSLFTTISDALSGGEVEKIPAATEASGSFNTLSSLTTVSTAGL